jgi:hypothetical protein
MYSDELEIKDTTESEVKDTTESDISDLYRDILLNIDSNGILTITLYGKRFNFAIDNFPFLCSNIPLSYSFHYVYISQLNICAKACFAYENFSK